MTAEALAVSRPAFGRRQVHAVAACYFVASFAALGLPPYFTQILPELGDRAGRWAGVLYVVPTVFSALAAPLWGRLADRFGRKRLLLRAQLGLAVSFLLAGWADSLTMFTAALVLQGILGGTFAASNGYLGAALDGPRLSRALTLMQGSARAALVFAPIVVGALSPWLSPHRQYALLALLPLAAALLLAALPEPAEAEETDGRERECADPAPKAALRRLYALEFAFVFSTVISFPYLISLVQERLPGACAALSGLLFALPHLCYLLTALAVHRAVRSRPRHGIALGFALIALGLAGHGVADTLPGLVAVRLVLGAGLTLGMVGLSVLAADCARGRAPGGMFGSLEFFSKAGAVAAGVTAAVGSARFGPAAPVLIGGGIAALTVFATLLPPHPRTRWSH
ncbi:MFS transporter [Streptomyces caniscabiei]|uniref:MFS transporter n=2 Tax=Streptomyces caniscabiei TaxID=2746961 RepID=A0A927QFQ6_9ACTN|nr:MFS transporter [Streptomyces caniscabiei]MBD9725338.1 MFS transporter [Streptomyces caniscabiei]MDX3510888.1 MFS transporter [Streptomyces caniscabiei]MDX3720168.1 MFS transporter [Streptomyces caniscabiei]MDX3729352.1 MFS transporter [Streptomyces caniscabiei]WEO29274.1 MFS transporter [Streptomyces caniscabiei]